MTILHFEGSRDLSRASSLAMQFALATTAPGNSSTCHTAFTGYLLWCDCTAPRRWAFIFFQLRAAEWRPSFFTDTRLAQPVARFTQLSRPPFSVADMLDRTHVRVRRSTTSLLEWHRWFSWHPVTIVKDGKLRYAWLRFIERKWGPSRYSGTMKWRYRPRTRSRSR